MVCIYFSNRDDAAFFQQAVRFSKGKWNVKPQEYQTEFQLITGTLGQAYEDTVTALVELFRERKLLGWLEGVLRYSYYYTDPQEIQRILEVAQEYDPSPPEGHSWPPLFEEVSQNIDQMLQETYSVEFDHLCVHVLKAVHQTLIDYTGKLIDEYKLEEAHQLMVDSWRQRVSLRDTGVQLLHIKDDSPFRYYHAEGNELREAETLLYMNQYPDSSIRDLPLDWDLTPALVHAPDQLIIYSDRQGVGKLELLVRIFEEKATWKPLKDFPF
ncbi:putative sporulation protein YtxC [Halobacillus salinarum]|uniref:Sporulation protein YtxC n=1 Tax=Halobacillus salinarum TaxID=2932257 RepID=A0ABY4EP74_9BACI|nr:putative sporulation protein YtxC [Halobacillus salinarum]UOQ46185.1 putative sporulation protein YtxC [Halobacillus salinarum]